MSPYNPGIQDQRGAIYQRSLQSVGDNFARIAMQRSVTAERTEERKRKEADQAKEDKRRHDAALAKAKHVSKAMGKGGLTVEQMAGMSTGSLEGFFDAWVAENTQDYRTAATAGLRADTTYKSGAQTEATEASTEQARLEMGLMPKRLEMMEQQVENQAARTALAEEELAFKRSTRPMDVEIRQDELDVSRSRVAVAESQVELTAVQLEMAKTEQEREGRDRAALIGAVGAGEGIAAEYAVLGGGDPESIRMLGTEARAGAEDKRAATDRANKMKADRLVAKDLGMQNSETADIGNVRGYIASAGEQRLVSQEQRAGREMARREAETQQGALRIGLNWMQVQEGQRSGKVNRAETRERTKLISQQIEAGVLSGQLSASDAAGMRQIVAPDPANKDLTVSQRYLVGGGNDAQTLMGLIRQEIMTTREGKVGKIQDMGHGRTLFHVAPGQGQIGYTGGNEYLDSLEPGDRLPVPKGESGFVNFGPDPMTGRPMIKPYGSAAGSRSVWDFIEGRSGSNPVSPGSDRFFDGMDTEFGR